MKNLIAAILTTSALATPVALANGHVPPPPATGGAKIADWAGFKLGAQIGYGNSRTKTSYTDPNNDFLTYKTTHSISGILGGIHAGYDYQWKRNWLFGLEAYFDFAGLRGKHSENDNGGQIFVIKGKMDWTVAVMARAGYVIDNSLFYAGIGWAGSEWKAHTVYIPSTGSTPIIINKKKFLSGLRLALGAAHKIDRVIVGIEGGYTWYGTLKGANLNYDGQGHNARIKMKQGLLEVKLKLSYMI